jgi:hypothetical protein|tara:strand:- start:917 stop:1258 length:342 start_codon:yes stop_codon:yes gene_type:complete
MSESSNAEQLIGVLINKMESMDSNLMLLKAENDALKRLINNPDRLLRKMGLVNVSTPLTDDVQTDPFRGDMTLDSSTLLKSSPEIGAMSNEDIHAMSWEDIHEMALSAKEATQ